MLNSKQFVKWIWGAKRKQAQTTGRVDYDVLPLLPKEKHSRHSFVYFSTRSDPAAELVESMLQQELRLVLCSLAPKNGSNTVSLIMSAKYFC